LLPPILYEFQRAFPDTLRPDSTHYGTVEQFRELYPDAYWEVRLRSLTNEDGSLAWTVSQDMLALAVLHDQTGDPWYLGWLRRMSEGVIAARDDLSGKETEEGRSLPGWGTTRYGEGKRRIYLVHSALIVNPVLEWAIRADRAPDWSKADEEKRQEIIERCKETLLHHDYQLEPEPFKGEMVYNSGHEEEERRYSWQPFNRQNVVARDFYLLHKLTGEPDYLERSRKLYTFFKTRLEPTPSGAYVWEYEAARFTWRIPVASCDDISHGSFGLLPVLSACRDGFVFDAEDMGRFARTFTRYIHLGNGVFQSGIGCTPQFQPRYLDRLYAWLPLTEADRSIYPLIRGFLMGNVEKPAPLAIAFLVAYRPKGMSGIDTRSR
jgi:hypothetical protein